MQLVTQLAERVDDQTLKNGQQDDDDEEEERDVEHDSRVFILFAFRWLDDLNEMNIQVNIVYTLHNYDSLKTKKVLTSPIPPPALTPLMKRNSVNHLIQ